MVGAIFYFVASKGLSTFFVDKINVFDFLFGTVWNPSATGPDGKPMVGALPMILGSFMVTFLSAIVATPFAIGAAVFMTEISPTKGQKFLQPVIELLVGIPSVVYGFIGLSVIVPFIRSVFGGTGFGENNVLWSLALILLFMSLVFNIVIRYIGKKGEITHG